MNPTALLVLLAWGCSNDQGGETGKGGAPADDSASVASCSYEEVGADVGSFEHEERLLDPADVDDSITWLVPSKQHLVVMPQHRDLRPELWVHFTGSNSSPAGATNIAKAAAYAGYRVISLAYPNEPSISEICADQPEDCERLVRQETITGEDVSTKVEVDADNCIENRLLTLLAHMHGLIPDGGFDAYSAGDELLWSQIAVSGWSQGGGMAGFISKDHSVPRAVFFSKGVGSWTTLTGTSCDTATPCEDGNCFDGECVVMAPVEWAEDERQTQGPRLFGIYHTLENAAYYTPQAFESWGLLDYGAAVDSDTRSPDYDCAHALTTSLPADEDSYHQSIGTDDKQPTDEDGMPMKFEAWLYMMTVTSD